MRAVLSVVNAGHQSTRVGDELFEDDFGWSKGYIDLFRKFSDLDREQLPWRFDHGARSLLRDRDWLL